MSDKKPESPGIEIVIDGRKTTIHMDALTGRDVKDFRGEVGFAPMRVFRDTDLMDIDVIAAFVWIERRRGKPQLTYDEVLGSITYENVDVTITGNVEDDEDDPEA